MPTSLIGSDKMQPDGAQVLRAFGDLSVSDGWKVLGNMLDLMVSRTPGDSSHFHALCARVQGISAEIPTPEATPPPGGGGGGGGYGAQFGSQRDQSQPASESASDNPSPSLSGIGRGDQSEHTTGEPPSPRAPASGNTPPHDQESNNPPPNNPPPNNPPPKNPPPKKPPPKKPPPFGEQRFAKLAAVLRSEVQPNPSLLLEKACDLFKGLRGVPPVQEEINSADPWRRQLFKHLKNLEEAEKGIDANALLNMTISRYRSYQFALEYKKERKVTDAEDARKRNKRKRREASPRQPKKYTKIKKDRALIKLIQDCWGLSSSVKIPKDDRRRYKAIYWLDIGLPMLGLVERLGYAAFIAPALLVSQSSLKTIGRNQINDFVDYVDNCYIDFKMQLKAIEPVAKDAICSAGLTIPLLWIDSLTPETKSLQDNFSIDRWLSPIQPVEFPIQQDLPDQYSFSSHTHAVEDTNGFQGDNGWSMEMLDDDSTNHAINSLSFEGSM